MQKKLIAVAVAGLAASGAFAQSNVEIYGLVDLSVVSMTGTYQGRVENTTTVANVAAGLPFAGVAANGITNSNTAVFYNNSNGYFNGVGKSNYSWNGLANPSGGPQGMAGTHGAAAMTSNNASAAQEYGSRAELANGMKEVSRIGFRGTEDLGGGLKAGFVIESSIAADGGTANGSNATPTANIIGDREATVSLTSSNWGRVKLGRQSVANTDLIGYFDPFLGKGPGGVEQLIINPMTTTTANNSIRFDTKIMDVNLTYQYAMAENSDRLNNTSGPGSVTGLAAYYAAGPLKVTAGHAIVRDYANAIGASVNTAIAATTLGATGGQLLSAPYMGRSLWLNHLGARYDFGPAEIYAQYMTTQSNKTASDESGGQVVGGTQLTQNAFGGGSANAGLGVNGTAYYNLINMGILSWLGQGGPMVNSSTYLIGFSTNNYFGAHKLLGSFVGTNDKRTWNMDARSLALGYEYSLSKRTTLQLRGAKVYNTNGSAFGVVAGGGQNVALNTTTGHANQRTTAYLAGIKHTF